MGGALVSLFLEHGAPLVIKADNDSAFTAREARIMLVDWELFFLLSPPRTPSYNGACEAGIGSLKTRAHPLAARQGRPGRWSCDDVEAARIQANETAHPDGPRNPTPDVAWTQRTRITAKEIRAFACSVRRYERDMRNELGLAGDGRSHSRAHAPVRRVAITRALVKGGFLFVMRRGITSPIRYGKAHNSVGARGNWCSMGVHDERGSVQAWKRRRRGGRGAMR